MKYLVPSLLALGLVACGGGADSETSTVETPATDVSSTSSDLTQPEGPHAWAVDYDASQVGFVGTQTGNPVEGGFGQFKAAIELDPANPSDVGSIAATITMGSVDAGTAQRNDFLTQKVWFWVKEYPLARFESDDVQRIGDGRYVANGTLTIRDKTIPVSLPFRLSVANGRAVADGELTLDRLDFDIGNSDLITEDDVARQVTVNVHIEATKAE